MSLGLCFGALGIIFEAPGAIFEALGAHFWSPGGTFGESWAPWGGSRDHARPQNRKSELFPSASGSIFEREELPDRYILLFFRMSGFSCFVDVVRHDLYRLLDVLKSQMCGACHDFRMFFMFRKSIYIW